MVADGKVMVVGGGVAGLSAALQLADQKISTLLVEKEHGLGGHAALYACKATETCVSCGACIVEEKRDRVAAHSGIEVMTQSRVSAITRGDRFSVVISKETSAGGTDEIAREVDAVIISAGFEPFNPQSKPYGYRRLKNVVTHLELEKILRQKSLPERPSDGKVPANMAFIQCVGSRDAQLGHLWCSKVCCASAMRMARLIRMRLPQTAITIFYIDIQTFGKEFQRFYNALRGEVTLVRTIPGDIFPAEAGRLRVTYYESGLGESRDELFDLVVLAVGMTPVGDSRSISDMFEIPLDPGGFLPESHSAAPAPAGVFAAGAVCGPMSIAESLASGIEAAVKASEYIMATT